MTTCNIPNVSDRSGRSISVGDVVTFLPSWHASEPIQGVVQEIVAPRTSGRGQSNFLKIASIEPDGSTKIRKLRPGGTAVAG